MKFTDRIDQKAINDSDILPTDFSQTQQTNQSQIFSFNDYDFKPRNDNVFAKVHHSEN
jgi:hypothetical protein|tara:strand:+ start:1390 stop:1563 length:174 start_codon:yes stop_codon:yes gene_type:complete